MVAFNQSGVGDGRGIDSIPIAIVETSCTLYEATARGSTRYPNLTVLTIGTVILTLLELRDHHVRSQN